MNNIALVGHLKDRAELDSCSFETPMEIVQGNRFYNRFKIVACLGQGALGSVFVAADGADKDKLVAIRVFREGLLGNGEFKERIVHRLAENTRVEHENVLQPLEFLEEGKLQACTMEYADGGNLASQVQQGGRLEITRMVSILRQVADALASIHEHGSVHHDVKPTNVLLMKDGTVKLADCAVARVHEEQKGVAFKIGTAQYKAPEYLRSGRYDAGCDLYALGVIAHELYYGDMPAEEMEFPTISDKLPLEPELRNSDCPELENIIERAVHPDRSRRYQRASEMQADLERLERKLTQKRSPSFFIALVCLYLIACLSGLAYMSRFLELG
jgi:eukaryotic-like serine/threonine-protein kinase